ncbi:putative transcriptional regulator [Desulfosporosinus orientis DSM 765]|uniref:Putative transcriptional regulator n=1 Tax=Desulfosporosinus orientis (strain ATCC 19365 / DSM 765 / NCIMB 8382 / VKM B-1628 / Singapore I) TaxID=768706 RepID=G7W6C6_DESOD|nr:MerR family transcriptional regulator [Desulfosporosinus orientis]AET68133.1 putative transcriptional regulator [Desulfosporosinus orientis DSM 765]
MKKYTIKDAAKIMNVPTSTIRFYDKEGLLPFMERMESGYRVFSEEDLAMLRTIDCLKKTGMPIKEIRQFIDWVQQGDASLTQRYEMFLERKKVVESQMAELQSTLEIVNFKCWYYKAAIEAGSEKPIEEYVKKEMLAREEASQNNNMKI